MAIKKNYTKIMILNQSNRNVPWVQIPPVSAIYGYPVSEQDAHFFVRGRFYQVIEVDFSAKCSNQ
jgi:hypothetical protein